MKTASEMTYTVSSGALNSTPTPTPTIADILVLLVFSNKATAHKRFLENFLIGLCANFDYSSEIMTKINAHVIDVLKLFIADL